MTNFTIYLVRHGKIQLPDTKRRFVGQIDPPLSEEGIRQAGVLGGWLQNVHFNAIFCSDLHRTCQTAQIIAAGRKTPVCLKGLREIHLGEWEGKTFSEIAEQNPREFKARDSNIAYYRITGGESFADCRLSVACQPSSR